MHCLAGFRAFLASIAPGFVNYHHEFFVRYAFTCFFVSYRWWTKLMKMSGICFVYFTVRREYFYFFSGVFITGESFLQAASDYSKSCCQNSKLKEIAPACLFRFRADFLSVFFIVFRLF